ncbi:hypothetical protein [Saccharopolyspora taberi]|uniref:YggT family protein n=1 Tax=Saccharopolyspora taberi TaxID=60895 RepID=A0ABN3VLM8_9PSEU
MSDSDSAQAFSGGRRRKHSEFDAARFRARAVGVATTLVRWVGTLAAVLLVVHVVLTVGGANPDNGITRFVAEWADPLALGFSDLFMPQDPQLAVLLNYGIAAVFWLVVTSIAVRVLRLLGK